MDLNVKLQGFKYNLRKDQGCFCKMTSIGYFPNLLNYFSTKNLVE
jgi:hypothetical protein